MDEQELATIKDEDKKAQSSGRSTTSYGFAIDSTRIRSAPLADQSAALQQLGVDVFNQEDFEEGVLRQVDEAIAVKETQEAIEGWERELKAVDEDIRNAEGELFENSKILQGLEQNSSTSYGVWRRMLAVKKQQDNKLKQLKKLQAKQKSLHQKLGIGEAGEFEGPEGSSATGRSGQFFEEDEDDDRGGDDVQHQLQLPSTCETEQERLIKTGQMTPFGSTVLPSTTHAGPGSQTTSHIKDAVLSTSKLSPSPTNSTFSSKDQTKLAESDGDEEYVPDDTELRDSWYEEDTARHVRGKAEVGKVGFKRKLKAELNVRYEEEDGNTAISRMRIKRPRDVLVKKAADDGNEGQYRQRIRELRIKELMKKKGLEKCEGSDSDDLPDMELDQGCKVPGKVWHKLYKYQKTGVKWLWELHSQQAGGIVGDEMGLGKTIQVIAFLAGLKYSNISTRNSSKRAAGLGPVLIVCPVTVLHQWVAEFHKWWPEFRVAILHDTGSFQGPRKALVKKIWDCAGVLVTSYSGVRAHQEALLARKFDYVILDEGHKIRNPDAEITLACKQFRTCHRIILSGSTMQNNLKELWSLFDFVFPGKLGTLPVFMAEFSVPITMGGYANASDVQVQTAYKCACVLRDTINPYLLRRMKKDVQMSIDIPSKSEQVLFCRLADEQRQLYRQYLDSREVQSILAGNYKVFPGLIMLRKICNHPDLTSEAGSLLKAKQDALEAELGLTKDKDPAEGYGDWRRAGKMIVLEALLKMWKFQGHRVLVFSQTRQMLNILESFVASQGYTYRRMDGSTSVASRQPLISKFNQDSSIFVFLLTTRVGGLGVNLVGANRVILYDPDWNPSTDTQARERAWRIGQTRDVTIYRLLTSGTIEEKIYHRQIFKQFLTNRVLKDPKQRRFFKTNDLYELFTLSDEKDKPQETETSAIFAGTNCEVKVQAKKKKKNADLGKKGRGRGKLFKLGSVARQASSNGKKHPPAPATAATDAGAFSVDVRDVQELDKRPLARGRASETSGGADGTVGGRAGTSEASGHNKNTGVAREVELSNTGGILRGDRSMSAGSAPVDPERLVASRSDGVQATEGGICEERGTLAISSVRGIKNNGGTATPAVEGIQKSSGAAARTEARRAEQRTGTARRKSPLGSGNGPEAVAGPSHGERESAGSRVKMRKSRKRKLSNLSDDELKKKLRIKEKKKKRRRTKLDGQTVDHLDYHEMFSPEGSGAEDLTREKKQTANQDELILKTLFSRTGVHSALKHDVIMESGDPDNTLVEMEANRVAKQAARALKQSRQRCRSAASGIPTWTGVSGAAGLPSSPAPQRPRFGKRSTVAQPKLPERGEEPKALFSGVAMGMTNADSEQSKPLHSSQLLAKMRARNNVVPGEGPAEGTNVQVPKTEYDELVVEIRNFIAFKAREVGSATTQEIVDVFGPKLPLNDSTVFRSLLKQICTFVRDQDTKTGVWKLKPEFC